MSETNNKLNTDNIIADKLKKNAEEALELYRLAKEQGFNETHYQEFFDWQDTLNLISTDRI